MIDVFEMNLLNERSKQINVDLVGVQAAPYFCSILALALSQFACSDAVFSLGSFG